MVKIKQGLTYLTENVIFKSNILDRDFILCLACCFLFVLHVLVYSYAVCFVATFSNSPSVCIFKACLRYIFNSREAIAAIIGDIVVFLQFKEFELYWGTVFFFKICSHIFMIFEVKLE